MKTINVNVNVEVYSPKFPSVQQTLQFTPLVMELSLIWSHLLWGESSAFSAANEMHNFSNFPGTITAGWTEAVWYEKFFAQHLYTLINFREFWGTG